EELAPVLLELVRDLLPSMVKIVQDLAPFMGVLVERVLDRVIALLPIIEPLAQLIALLVEAIVVASEFNPIFDALVWVIDLVAQSVVAQIEVWNDLLKNVLPLVKGAFDKAGENVEAFVTMLREFDLKEFFLDAF